MAKPRIVAVPWNGQGHITPMMHLCGYLAKNGFSITFAVLADLIPAFEMMQMKGTWPPPGSDITIQRVFTDAPPPDPASIMAGGRVQFSVIYEFSSTFQNNLEKLVEGILPGGGVACLICDYQTSWALPVADKFGIPGAVLFTGCAAWSWTELEMPRHNEKNIIPMQDEDLSKEDDYLILEDPPVWRSDIPRHYWNDQRVVEYTIKWNSGSLTKAAWVLSATCQELEESMVKFMQEKANKNYVPIGPIYMLNEDPSSVGCEAGDPQCIEWLAKQPDLSVLYIALGSFARLSPEQLEEFATGLEESKQRFLWVTRMNKEKDFEEFYTKWYEKNKERGLIVSWAPQADVLAHPAVGAFMSHCGWNSTIESVGSGKPILCWPCLFDQKLNSRLICDEWKVGSGFKKGDKQLVDKEEIEGTIRKVMEGEAGKEMRARAQELSFTLKKAVSPGGSSYNNLQAFVNDIAKA